MASNKGHTFSNIQSKRWKKFTHCSYMLPHCIHAVSEFDSQLQKCCALVLKRFMYRDMICTLKKLFWAWRNILFVCDWNFCWYIFNREISQGLRDGHWHFLFFASDTEVTSYKLRVTSTNFGSVITPELTSQSACRPLTSQSGRSETVPQLLYCISELSAQQITHI